MKFGSQLLTLIVLLFLFHDLLGWTTHFPVRNRFPGSFLLRSTYSDAPEGGKAEPNENTIFNEKARYFDFNRPNVELDRVTTRSLPLFVLGSVHFPSSIAWYNVFEMKYRTMMFHISQKDDQFGIILSNPVTGQLANIGTLCKIIGRKLNEDGSQYITVQGLQRFELIEIEKTSPYITALVHLNVTDQEIPPSDEMRCRSLEIEVYSALKFHQRLVRKISKANVSLPLEMKDFRPLFPRPASEVGETQHQEDLARFADQNRRSNFSLAVASFLSKLYFGFTDLQLGFEDNQVLLQTTDLLRRLEEEKKLLTFAIDLLTAVSMRLQGSQKTEISLMKEFAMSDFTDDDLYLSPPNLLDKVSDNKEPSSSDDEWDLLNTM